MRMSRSAAILAVALVAHVLAGRTRAAELQPIDCGSSPFGVTDAAYHVDCERSKDNLHVEETTGSVQLDVITVSSDDRQVFFTVVSQLVLAPRIYLEHRNLSESFHSTFDHADVAEWKGLGNKGGYDVAEFKSDVSGQQSVCIAIQRFTNPAWTGFKRHIIGMGCATGGLDPVYRILSELKAPGD